MKKIYTLGTGLRTFEDFIEILGSCTIEAVIDVRSYPVSKFDHFRKKNLESLLKKEFIEYHFLGRELGGFRKEGYEQYTHTPEFEQGIGLLETIASSKTSTVICAERFPWKCHRRFIARALHGRGWTVEHIIDKGKLWIPK
ncbi:MAG: DUF488 domain-containing protein [Nitrospiraceae bacterium]|nr:MAG: DUF488 domain-containing protein [Nitrospiraceae bacterium]